MQVVAEIEESHSLMHEYLGSLSSWLNLYFQFSGYSDVAIGFSLIMGFRIIENFDNPFLSQNIREFWQRWHISLTSWCREYVYMPLAALTRKPFFALLAAMVLIGLWHGFSIRYVLWGVYHGLGIAVWHSFQSLKKNLPVWGNTRWRYPVYAVSVFLTFNFVIASFTVTNFAYDKIRGMF
jgi:alginate O-acetyltransferase complex protein AlgI